MPEALKEAALVSALHAAGVLRRHDAYQLDPDKKGVILVACGDCDRSPELLDFARDRLGHRRIHLIAINGGALNLPRDSPLIHMIPRDEVILEDIRETPELKNLNTVAAYAHWPCGKAKAAGVSMLQALDLLIGAKHRIREHFPHLRVATFLHVDHGDGSNETWFVAPSAWGEWKARTSPDELVCPSPTTIPSALRVSTASS